MPHAVDGNAMIYGGVAEEDGTLSVARRYEEEDTRVAIEWVERRPSRSRASETATGTDADASASSSGFGARLIDAGIRLELNDTIERSQDEAEQT